MGRWADYKSPKGKIGLRVVMIGSHKAKVTEELRYWNVVLMLLCSFYTTLSIIL